MNDPKVLILIRRLDPAATSDDLIREAAALLLGCAPADLPPIRREPGKKPRFDPADGLYFSLSHSGDYRAAAVSRQELGLDLQQCAARYNYAVARRFFHPDEYEHLSDNGFADFFDVWTAKESYVKYTGAGLSEAFGDLCVVDGCRLADAVDGVKLRQLPFRDDYRLCLCARDVGTVEVRVIDEP